MLETTARKDDYVSLISYVQRMEDARRAKQTLHWISDKKPLSITHYLERYSLEKHWTDKHGMERHPSQSIKQRRMEGVDCDVLVTGRTKGL